MIYIYCVYTHKHKLTDQLQITGINQDLYHQVGAVRIPVVHSTGIASTSSIPCYVRRDVLTCSLTPSLPPCSLIQCALWHDSFPLCFAKTLIYYRNGICKTAKKTNKQKNLRHLCLRHYSVCLCMSFTCWLV